MRKYYYLKPNIQHAFTTFFAVITAIEIALFGLALFLLEHLRITNSYDMQLYARFTLVFLLILIFSGFNFWYGIRLSHRIVGPMIQIKRILESAMKEDYQTRINLRATDYLHEVADELNLLLEKLEKQQSGKKEFPDEKK